MNPEEFRLNEGLRFKTRMDGPGRWAAPLVFVVFLIAGLLAKGALALFPIGLAILVVVLVVPSRFQALNFYHVSPRGLFLRRIWFKDVFSPEEIAAVEALEEDTAKEFLLGYERQAAERAKALLQTAGIKEILRINKEKNLLIRHLTTSIMFQRPGRSAYDPSKIKVFLKGAVVKLTLADGRIYLLSPVDVARFIEAVSTIQKNT
ncbi:MAG: hypothetical protein JNM63_11520, partial [Spirochaetia bacterium]|nr:hypothetical protein [Spirochaetia bacterium]